MPHAEMVLVLPVIVFTFLVMGWIVSRFRGYLKQRDAIVDSWGQQATAPVHQNNQSHAHRHAA